MNERLSSMAVLNRTIADLERQLKILQDENKWLRDHDNEWCVFYYQVKEKDKEIKRLRDALDKYGRHFGECRVYKSKQWSGNELDGKCSCGFEQALKGEKK